MTRKTQLSPENINLIRTARERGESIRSTARAIGVSPGVVTRALQKIVDRTRTAEEFKAALAVSVRPPTRKQGPFSWSIEEIRKAVDAQLRGDFQMPVRLAEAMRRDDALFTAYHNRIAPQSAVQAVLTPCAGTRGKAVARKAASSVFVARSVLEGIHGTMANHGIAIGYIEHEPSDDGTRVDMRLTEWPLEHVRWNPSTETLETRTREFVTVPIMHGDSRWAVFRKFYDKPWTQEACVLPGGLLWGAHANCIRDWAASSTSHGQAKIVGELPEGVPLQQAEGTLSPQALAFLSMLQDLVSGEAGAGIRPAGSKTDFLSNGSTAWQVFNELLLNREKAAARIYLGTDAMLGSVGGAPGVDIATLFGVATTKVQGDFTALEQGLYTGVYQPWTAINEGDSRYAPSLRYQMPDPDAEAKSIERAAKLTRLLDTIKRMREEQMEVSQSVVDALAADIGVTPAPALASVEAARVPLILAPTDVARVVRVREARASQGLPPLGDARDDLFISELEAKAEAPQAAPTLKKLSALDTELESLAQGDTSGGAEILTELGLAGDFDESKHPRADDGRFGTKPGSSAPKDRQSHFDESASRAGSIAKQTGLDDAMRDFLNTDRATVSRAEWSGQPHPTSDRVNKFLKIARQKGGDYKGQVFRGTTHAELDHLLKHGTNKRTWSVSKDPEGSATFAKKGGVLLVIAPNSGAVPVDGIDGSNTFNEALLPRNTKFAVKERRKRGNVEIVEIEATE